MIIIIVLVHSNARIVEVIHTLKKRRDAESAKCILALIVIVSVIKKEQL